MKPPSHAQIAAQLDGLVPTTSTGRRSLIANLLAALNLARWLLARNVELTQTHTEIQARSTALVLENRRLRGLADDESP